MLPDYDSVPVKEHFAELDFCYVKFQEYEFGFRKAVFGSL